MPRDFKSRNPRQPVDMPLETALSTDSVDNCVDCASNKRDGTRAGAAYSLPGQKLATIFYPIRTVLYVFGADMLQPLRYTIGGA
jgi:hypothetical protein